MIISTTLALLFGAWLIFKGARHAYRERGKAQWLKVPGKFPLRGKRKPMAIPADRRGDRMLWWLR